jgi:Spy/CpxP family protein refolding chaperone
MAKKDSLFVAGKAQWLLENARKLTPDQRALLLAMADLDVQAGHVITPEERAALDALAAQGDGYDPAEIEQAMKHMVEAKPTHKVGDWPKGLVRKVRKTK